MCSEYIYFFSPNFIFPDRTIHYLLLSNRAPNIGFIHSQFGALHHKKTETKFVEGLVPYIISNFYTEWCSAVLLIRVFCYQLQQI